MNKAICREVNHMTRVVGTKNPDERNEGCIPSKVGTGSNGESTNAPEAPSAPSQGGQNTLDEMFDRIIAVNLARIEDTSLFYPPKSLSAGQASSPPPMPPIIRDVSFLWLPAGFAEESSRFFDGNHEDHTAIDEYFNRFTSLWGWLVRSGLYSQAQAVWIRSIEIADDWMSANQPKKLHLGTPYYFFGGTCVLAGQLDKGFLLLHKAYEEDKQTEGRYQVKGIASPKFFAKDGPAYCLVALDPTNKFQFFRDMVQEIATSLDQYFDRYASSRGSSIQADEMKARFLKQGSGDKDQVFLLVYALFALKRMSQEFEAAWKQNSFAPILMARILSTLCLVTESAMRQKIAKKSDTLARYIAEFSNRTRMNLHYLARDNSIHYCKPKELTGVDFPTKLAILTGSTDIHFDNGKTLSDIEEDFVVLHELRNHTAHTPKSEQLIQQHFTELSQRILNTLFRVVETLY